LIFYSESVADGGARYQLVSVAEVVFSLNAIVVVAQVPGLIARVRDELASIIETALAIWPSVHWSRRVSPDDLLSMRMGGCSITYTLDLARRTANVLSATPLKNDDDALSWSAA
jgi:hypothetical protein